MLLASSACDGSPNGPTPTPTAVKAVEIKVGLDDGNGQFGTPVTELRMGVKVKVTFIYETDWSTFQRTLKVVLNGFEQILANDELHIGAQKSSVGVLYTPTADGTAKFVGTVQPGQPTTVELTLNVKS